MGLRCSTHIASQIDENVTKLRKAQPSWTTANRCAQRASAASLGRERSIALTPRGALLSPCGVSTTFRGQTAKNYDNNWIVLAAVKIVEAARHNPPPPHLTAIHEIDGHTTPAMHEIEVHLSYRAHPPYLTALRAWWKQCLPGG